LFSVPTDDCFEWAVAEATDEALELLVVYDAEREDWGGDTLAEGVPDAVAFLAH
jgi:hypothetical protein